MKSPKVTSGPSAPKPKSPSAAGFEQVLIDLTNDNPGDMEIRAATRIYIQMKAALGITTDPRHTASYASAQRHYERLTGSRWSGNP